MSGAAVLFDLDGTLVDTAPDLGGALQALRSERDLEPLDDAAVRGQVSNGAAGLVRLGFPEACDGPQGPALRERLLALYADRVADRSRLFDGMPETLRALEERALPWGIVTNKPTRFTQPLLEALALDRRAGCVVCGDTLAQRKPDPEPLLHAADQLQRAPSACIYVGDALRDVQAARAAGMLAVVVSYGYIDAADDPTAWGADHLIDRPAEILEFCA